MVALTESCSVESLADWKAAWTATMMAVLLAAWKAAWKAASMAGMMEQKTAVLLEWQWEIPKAETKVAEMVALTAETKVSLSADW